MQLLAKVLTTFDVVGPSIQSEVELAVAAGLVDCLLAFLKGLKLPSLRIRNPVFTSNSIEPTSAELSKRYIADAAAFVKCLISCLFAAQSLNSTQLSNGLILNCFAVLLEASLYCPNVWEVFRTADQATALLGDIILKNTSYEVREGVADRLRGIFAVLPT